VTSGSGVLRSWRAVRQLLAQKGQISVWQICVACYNQGMTRSDIPSLVLLGVLASVTQGAEIFSTNSVWRFLEGRTEASTPDTTAWRRADFEDVTFTNAPAPFTYGENYAYGTLLSNMINQYSCIFLRRSFEITNPAEVAALRLGAKVDDGFVAWINGVEVQRVNMPLPAGSPVTLSNLANNATEPVPFVFYNLPSPASYLVTGSNVMCVQVFNTSIGSSDLVFDCSLESIPVDTRPPALASISPAPGTVSGLTQLTVVLTEPVVGVKADDLLINRASASTVSGSGATYTFTFPQPVYGGVHVAWAESSAIEDLALPPNWFDVAAAGSTWDYDLVDVVPPQVVNIFPPAQATVRGLAQIEVSFDEPVSGVDAADLLINGQPATHLILLPGPIHVFQFPPPPTGVVEVAWANGHGITDLALAPNAFIGAPWSYLLDPGLLLPALVITEIDAANQTGLADEDGRHEDWIEIQNRGSNAVDLAGWSLSDNSDWPGQWVFPSQVLGAGELLVVFASGKDRRAAAGANHLHTNFKLGMAGEFLGLYSADSPRALVSGFSPRYPEQRSDVSYGLDPHGALLYFATPNPGAPNGESTITGSVAPVHFSVGRGHFSQPFTLTLATPTPGATIRYTTDGSAPTLANGLPYLQPLRIASSTLLRAAAFRINFLPSLVGTHSYLFNLPASYRTLPVISIVTDADNLYGPAGIIGISNVVLQADGTYLPRDATGYHNPSKHGFVWERPTSIEWIQPGDNSGFQVDCGIRVQGSDYQRPRLSSSSKCSFRLYFRGDYGPGRLEYPLFPLTSVQSFDQLVLRAGFNEQGNPFIRDELTRRLSHDTGQVASHGTFAIVLINGVAYANSPWYNPCERDNESFLQTHLGGSPDWDVVSPSFAQSSGLPGVIDGDRTDFEDLVKYARTQPTTNLAVYQTMERRLDLTNFVDYLLLNVYCAMGDWPQNNWRAGRDRSTTGPWRFIVWDGEWAMGIYGRGVTTNMFANDSYGPEAGGLSSTNDSEIAQLYQSLYPNPEFRLLWADRIHKQMFNGGALTESNIVARFTQMQSNLLGVIPAMATDILTGWVPQRRGIVFGHFDQYGLMASSNAPVFSRHGGRVIRGFSLSMTASNGGGTIYFTTNGSDPRVRFTSAVADEAALYSGPIGLGQSVTVRARTLNGGKWSALTEAAFEVATLGVPLRITEMNYNPADNPACEFLELQNLGSAPIALGGMSFEGIAFTFSDGTSLAPGALLVLASDANPAVFTNRYPGVTVAGWYSGALNNGGERITLKDRYGNIITAVTYGRSGGWPSVADGKGSSLEVIDPLGDPNDPANWRASREPGGTPGAPSSSSPPSSVEINEVMAENLSAVSNGGTYPDWIELYNPDGSAVDLAGWSLTDEGETRKFVFQAGATLPAHGYLVVWCDALTNITPGWHTGFALNGGGDSVYLYDSSTNLVDAMSFGLQLSNYSVGRVGGEWVLTTPTANAANVAAAVGSASNLLINEWMANPLPGQHDWLEIYNRSASQPVALRGLYLATSNAVHRISSLSFIPPAGFAVLYADEAVGPDHLAFKLPASGGVIALADELAVEVDRVNYAAQTDGVSRGRLPDGAATLVNFVGTPSPGASNYTTNYAGPVLNELLARNLTAVTNAGGTPDFVELYNPNSTAWNLGGMSLSVDTAEPGQWVFPPGTMLGGGSYLVVWCDGARPASTNAGDFNTGRWLNGDSGGVYLYNPAGQSVNSIEYGFQVADRPLGVSAGQWRLLAAATPGAVNAAAAPLGAAPGLRFNEWMAAPATGPDWFELFNPTNLPVDMSGLFLSDEPLMFGTNQFRIPPLSFIGPQSFVRWVADGNAGQGRNHVNFNLNALGELLLLYGAAGTNLIDAAAFGAQQFGVAEGRLPDGGPRFVAFPGSATPGQPNYTRLATVVISEVLTHAGPGQEDAIELRNLTDQAVSIGGWFLSDASDNVAKFRIPDGTFIPPGGFRVIYQSQFSNGTPASFALNAAGGGELWLAEVDVAGAFTGNRTGASFGPAAQGVSFGRYETHLGVEYVALSQPTLGAANAEPLVGPVVINELMYHPPPGPGGVDDPEYLELLNLSSHAVELFEAAHPTNCWRLAGGVDFVFPATNVTLSAGAFLLVVDFDPVTQAGRLADFRARYGVPASVLVFGPYSGKLDNGGESVELLKPDAPSPSGVVPWVRADKVDYAAAAPWPAGAVDGGGLSLQRRSPGLYGNEPENWAAATPTPGAPNGGPVVAPPVITQSPRDRVAVPGAVVSFAVSARGSEPLSYQWRFNGMNLPAATNTTLRLDWIELEDEGSYDVFVASAGGSAFSASARLQVDAIPIIPEASPSRNVDPGTNVLFTVLARGSTPLSYQWLFKDAPLAGATASSLLLTNVQLAQMGSYTVVVSNRVGIAQATAFLGVKVKPTILQQPEGLTLLSGQDAAFSVMASGAAPMNFRWRRNGGTVVDGAGGAVILSGETNSTLRMTGVSYTNDFDRYTVVITNIGGSAPLSSNALLRVFYPPVLTVEPTNTLVNLTSNATLRATLRANPEASYRWWFNGTNLLLAVTDLLATNAVNISFTVTNVQPINEGLYTVTASNVYGTSTSTGAVLALRRPPVILAPPSSQAVLAGSTVDFSAVVSGTAPLRYLWRFLGTNLPNQTNATLTLLNVQAANEGTYAVVVTNLVGSVTSFVATLSLLVDSDGDGLPDAWEDLHGLNKSDPADGTADADGDGMNNRQEYLAGSDPTDPRSYLRLDGDAAVAGGIVLRFVAVSNKTYTVFCRDVSTGPSWTKLADVEPAPVNRLILMTNAPPGQAERYYRLSTPRTP
jgi:hypothetical protein